MFFPSVWYSNCDSLFPKLCESAWWLSLESSRLCGHFRETFQCLKGLQGSQRGALHQELE